MRELQRMERQAYDESDAARELRMGFRARVHKARSFAATLPAGTSILDVGCSDGTILAPLAERFDVHGVDGDERQVERAVRNGIKAVVGDIDPLPFDACSFDAAFAAEVMEHTLSPDRFLCEINRVLRPGGSLIMTVPNIRTPVGLLMLLYGEAPMYAARYRSPHFRDFTKRSLQRALANNGFSLLRLTGSAFMIPGLGPRFSMLADLVPSWADNFILLARKDREAEYDASHEFE